MTRTIDGPLRALDLLVNGRPRPEGIGPGRIEFSWRLGGAAAAQSAYEIEVAPTATPGSTTWRSGAVATSDPFGALYTGPQLDAAVDYSWRVRLWAPTGAGDGANGGANGGVGEDEAGPWSAPARFVTGLRVEDWVSQWVSAPSIDTVGVPLYLRGVIDVPTTAVGARAHVSALGWYRLYVNGHDVTGDALVPRWTPFDEAVEYQSVEVTDFLVVGLNVLTLVVADGRFRGTLGFNSKRAVYGDQLAAIAQVVIDLDDGNRVTLGTDDTWRAGHGSITASDPKTGEAIDFRVDDSAWFAPGPPPAGSVAVTTTAPRPTDPADGTNDGRQAAPFRELIGEDTQPVRAVATLAPTRLWRAPSGKILVDFGQNMAGVARLDLPASPGRAVTLTFSEALTPGGELDTTWILSNTAAWKQQERIFLGAHPVTFAPKFTIHGFRYLEINGLPDTTELDALNPVALVYSSDLEVTGHFESSDERLNQLWSNIVWSTISNFTDTATDCPTRERSGWTGDIQVFAPTALQVMDCQWFLRRYLDNTAREQLEDGRIPVVIPAEQSRHHIPIDPARSPLRAKTESMIGRAVNSLWRAMGTSVGWGDVSVLVPWELYRQRGDRQALAENYETMRRWVDQCEKRARTRRGLHRRLSRRRIGAQEQFILDSGFHWGEWLRPGEEFPSVLIDSFLHREVVATAYLARSARVLSDAADTLGRTSEATKYSQLADNVAAAWRTAFLNADGTIGTDRQDDYVRALAFDLLLPQHKVQAAARLVQLIEAAEHHLATGFLSTPMLLPVLTDHGHADVAFKLLLQQSAPSWLGQVTRGATTVWETWHGYDDEGFARESHNHYAFGAVGSWLINYLVGIKPTSPAYATATINPTIGGGLTHASARVGTPYGPLSAAWTLGADRTVTLSMAVPCGVEILLPAAGNMVITGPVAHTVTYSLED